MFPTSFQEAAQCFFSSISPLKGELCNCECWLAPVSHGLQQAAYGSRCTCICFIDSHPCVIQGQNSGYGAQRPVASSSGTCWKGGPGGFFCIQGAASETSAWSCCPLGHMAAVPEPPPAPASYPSADQQNILPFSSPTRSLVWFLGKRTNKEEY